MIEENVWRAIRYGLDGDLIDLLGGEPFPARDAIDRFAERGRRRSAPSSASIRVFRRPTGRSANERMLETGTKADLRDVYAEVIAADRGDVHDVRSERLGGST